MKTQTVYNLSMKTCNRCSEEKLDEEFPSRKYKSGKVSPGPYCWGCKREYDRTYWEQNASRREGNREKHKERVNRNKRYVRKALSLSSGCLDCGERNPIVLEFDHLRDKTHNVADLIKDGYSTDRIQEEIDKCEIVCANCHRIRTSGRGGWLYGE